MQEFTAVQLKAGNVCLSSVTSPNGRGNTFVMSVQHRGLQKEAVRGTRDWQLTFLV